MYAMVAIVILCIILTMLLVMTYRVKALPGGKREESETGAERMEYISACIYAAIVLVIMMLILCVYLLIKGTVWERHMLEWLNLVLRVMHITFGIAWIGASFYFVFLENALNRTENVREELAGNLWAIHGGGIYYLEKYKVAPRPLPRRLHWFKYEAYFTWLTGFALLFIVYYFNAEAFLIDKNVRDMPPLAAISTGIGSFIAAWLIYHFLCKTKLVNYGLWFAVTGFIIATGFAYFYSEMFSSRAAYIHFGSMLGSLMAANVFFIIIPSQKALVKAVRENKPLNPELGKHAALRSYHNNYFTLPVLFVMVSNHFPGTFGYEYAWALLAAVSLAAAGIKHWLNLREKGQQSVWVLPASVVLLLATCFISAPPKPGECKSEISFTEMHAIITSRCISCHSSRPTDEAWAAPPNGVVYDTPQDILNQKDKILDRVVITKTMPPNNKTNMTPDEREAIRCWIEQGASLK